MYVLGCRLSLFRLCNSDFVITAVDDITNGITWVVFCFHIAHISFASSWYLFCLSVTCFGEIVCFWNSYVYQLLLLLLLLSSLSSSVSPLCRVSTHIFLRQTISLGNTVLQLFWCNYSLLLLLRYSVLGYYAASADIILSTFRETCVSFEDGTYFSRNVDDQLPTYTTYILGERRPQLHTSVEACGFHTILFYHHYYYIH